MSVMICTACGAAAEPKRITKGSIWIEIILWLCFIVPGLIYSIWRLSSRRDGCRSCGSASLVPLDSPVGRKLIQEHHEGEDFKTNAEHAGQMLGEMFRKTVLRK
jgi:flagellar basal body-associated protein FliL